jgi:hypothetical protein
MRVCLYSILSLVCLLVFCSAVPASPLYKYKDDDGVVSYTDDPSDPRYTYERVQAYEPEKMDVKEAARKAKPEKQGKEAKASKEALSPEDAAEKDRMLKKVAELEGIKKTTTNEKYQEMLQSEIDLLKKQLNELDRKAGKGESHERTP